MSKESNAFEYEMQDILGRHGFWATVIPKSHDGSQPADIIAINSIHKHLIDAKLCSKERFTFSRCEENQRHSMMWFEDRCNGFGWFAVKYPNDVIYMIPYTWIKIQESLGLKSVGKDIPKNFELSRWLNAYQD